MGGRSVEMKTEIRKYERERERECVCVYDCDMYICVLLHGCT